MKIVFAQGNPGEEYSYTRHNVGFLIVDALAKKYDVSFKHQSKFRADIAEFSSGEKIIIVKPTTFYNDTGTALNAVAQFYKISPDDILVIHDELALPFGTIRSRVGGSDAGNNGIKSLNAHGGEVTKRLRIGVGNELRARMGDVNFVLGKFSASEYAAIQQSVIPNALDVISEFMSNQFKVTSQSVIE